jgi:hypothetical protein
MNVIELQVSGEGEGGEECKDVGHGLWGRRERLP